MHRIEYLCFFDASPLYPEANLFISLHFYPIPSCRPCAYALLGARDNNTTSNDIHHHHHHHHGLFTATNHTPPHRVRVCCHYPVILSDIIWMMFVLPWSTSSSPIRLSHSSKVPYVLFPQPTVRIPVSLTFPMKHYLALCVWLITSQCSMTWCSSWSRVSLAWPLLPPFHPGNHPPPPSDATSSPISRSLPVAKMTSLQHPLCCTSYSIPAPRPPPPAPHPRHPRASDDDVWLAVYPLVMTKPSRPTPQAPPGIPSPNSSLFLSCLY